MDTQSGEMRDAARRLDEVAGALDDDSTGLRRTVRAAEWVAPAADRCRTEVAATDASSRTAAAELRALAGQLRSLATAAEQVQRAMARQHDQAEAGLRSQLRDADPGRQPLLRAELAGLPHSGDASWARQAGAVAVPVAALPAAEPAADLGGASPAGVVRFTLHEVNGVARELRDASAAAGWRLPGVRSAVQPLELRRLDPYGLPGSAVQELADQVTGGGGTLARTRGRWGGCAGDVEALALLVDRAGAGLLPGGDIAALLADPRSELALDVLARLEVFPSGDGVRLLLLSGRTTEEIEYLLGVVPGLASRLADPGSAEPLGAGALRALPPEELRRYALLNPSLVGPVDGAPVDARYLANRVLITGARDDVVLELEGYVLRDQAYSGMPGEVRAGSGQRPADPEAVERAEGRLELFNGLLTQTVPNYDRDPGEPAEILRQVLLFDPTGDGRIAEVLGDLDAGTSNAAVLVPGTGADLDGHGSQLRRITDLRDRLPGGTAMISWLGSDMPDGVVQDAPFNHYADDGAGPLREFMAGVVTIAPGAVTTVLGHSYGGALVGAAEREGMRADRVLHLASAGASVDDVSDYPHRADRYAMMTPDDPIQWVQGIPGDSDVGHDGSPPQMFRRLETGAVAGDGPREGAPMTSGHDGYFRTRSDAFENILGVISGRTVSVYEPTPVEVMTSGGHAQVVEQPHPSTLSGYRPRTHDVPQ